jgi:hypothetical protein
MDEWMDGGWTGRNTFFHWVPFPQLAHHGEYLSSSSNFTTYLVTTNNPPAPYLQTCSNLSIVIGGFRVPFFFWSYPQFFPILLPMLPNKMPLRYHRNKKEQGLMLNKVLLLSALYQNWVHARLCLEWALIPIKPATLGFNPKP